MPNKTSAQTLIEYQHQSISQLIALSSEVLSSTSDSAKLDSRILLAFVLNKEVSYLLTWPEKIIAEHEFTAFGDLLKRRVQGEPIAYITCHKAFWDLVQEVYQDE